MFFSKIRTYYGCANCSMLFWTNIRLNFSFILWHLFHRSANFICFLTKTSASERLRRQYRAYHRRSAEAIKAAQDRDSWRRAVHNEMKLKFGTRTVEDKTRRRVGLWIQLDPDFAVIFHEFGIVQSWSIHLCEWSLRYKICHMGILHHCT